MFANMHERLSLIAKEDSDRADELGENCPSVLRICLHSGLEICGSLSDGENGLDDKTLDLIEAEHDVPGGGQVWIIALRSIAAVHQTYPTEERLAAARLKGRS